jgi:hypothetical protein
MDFFSNDGRRLETLADWRDHAGPVSGHQWAEGRSARELARAWIEGDAATQVTSLLTSAPGSAGSCSIVASPRRRRAFTTSEAAHAITICW